MRRSSVRRSVELLERLEERVVLSNVFSAMTPIADEIIVQYSPDANVQVRAMARNNAGFGILREVDSAQRIDMGLGIMEVVKIPSGVSAEDAIAWLSKQPGVEYAEQNQWIAPAAVSNDPYYTTSSRLWGMYGSDSPESVGPAGTTNQFGIHAENAWNAGYTGSNSVYVGIVDEGVQLNHPDLINNMWVNPYDPLDGIDNDGNGYVDDTNGWDFYTNDRTVYDGTGDDHGTHVAGTIGAEGGNGTGVAGVNWNVTMIVSKFLGANGGYLDGAVRAIDYVTDLKIRHGLDIVATNNSWGGGGYYRSLHEAILRSAKADILFVAAAGNSSANNDVTNSYPSNYSTLVGTSTVTAASYEGVIAVASITNTGALSSFSSYGATTVDIGAPGSSINSTLPTSTYGAYSGTSMATPHVTGAVALLASIYPNATAAQIRTAILGTATPTASLVGKTVTGGRLNVFAAISHPGLNPEPPPPPPQVPSVTISDASKVEGNSGSSNLVFNVTLSGTSTQPVSLVYATSNGTATAGSDYTATSGTLVIPAGATTGAISVAILGDYAVEANETFQLVISSATNATIADGTAIGTITNDDSTPSLSIANASLVEGNSGQANIVFTVTMSAVTDTPVTVDFGTFAGSAASGLDYVTTNGTLTIPAFATTATIAVPIIGDTEVEANETFEVRLSNPSSNATISAPNAVGTIVNDDVPAVTIVSLNIADAAVLEGRTGRTDMNFVVTLSEASTTDITVNFATESGSAIAGNDFDTAFGVLIIPAGSTTETIKVRIRGDRTFEPNETFFLKLSNPSSNVVLVESTAIGTILNDDSSGNSNMGDGASGNVDLGSNSIGLIAAPVPELDFVLGEWIDNSKRATRRA